MYYMEDKGLIKSFDESITLQENKLKELRELVSDVHGIHKWNPTMSDPETISEFECVYTFYDEIRRKNFVSNNKYTLIQADESCVHYSVLPFVANYKHNSIRISFINGVMRMERWFLQNKDYLTLEERLELMTHQTQISWDFLIKI